MSMASTLKTTRFLAAGAVMGAIVPAFVTAQTAPSLEPNTQTKATPTLEFATPPVPWATKSAAAAKSAGSEQESVERQDPVLIEALSPSLPPSNRETGSTEGQGTNSSVSGEIPVK